MRPSDLSEFSYGFALTYELLQSPGDPITAAPVFPSLIQEGQSGGGWDVKLNRPTVPLFLQFKLSDQMSRSTCKEAQDGFALPCYRMHVRGQPSRQHQMLLDLEADGQEVYYSAPAFHRHSELSDAFAKSEVRDRSLWLRPSDIGTFPDGAEHRVSFRLGGPWLVRSDPRPIKGRTFNDVASALSTRLAQQRGAARPREYWHDLANTLLTVVQRRQTIERLTAFEDSPRNRHPVELVALYASVHLQCQLLVAQLRG